jgi:hypothetical protein
MGVSTTDGHNILQSRRHQTLTFIVLSPAHNLSIVRDCRSVPKSTFDSSSPI